MSLLRQKNKLRAAPQQQTQLERFIFPPGFILEIVGNVASGKSTTAKKIQTFSNLSYVNLDPFETNPFLTHYVKNPKRFAFHTGLHFSLQRAKKIPEVKRRLNHVPLVFDQGFDMGLYVYSRLSRRNNEMTNDEWELLKELHTQMMQPTPTVTATIFIDVSVETIMERIKTRGRTHEQYYSEKYVQQLQETLTEYKQNMLTQERRNTIITYNQLEKNILFHRGSNKKIKDLFEMIL